MKQSKNDLKENVINEPLATYSSIGTLAIINIPTQKLFEITKKGIDYQTFESLLRNSPFTEKEISDYIHVSQKTISRRKQGKTPFSSLESEKILQIQQVLSKGLEVFKDQEKLKKWFNRENFGLGGKQPKELLENTFGIQLLMDELGRIEHGIFA